MSCKSRFDKRFKSIVILDSDPSDEHTTLLKVIFNEEIISCIIEEDPEKVGDIIVINNPNVFLINIDLKKSLALMDNLYQAKFKGKIIACSADVEKHQAWAKFMKMTLIAWPIRVNDLEEAINYVMSHDDNWEQKEQDRLPSKKELVEM